MNVFYKILLMTCLALMMVTTCYADEIMVNFCHSTAYGVVTNLGTKVEYKIEYGKQTIEVEPGSYTIRFINDEGKVFYTDEFILNGNVTYEFGCEEDEEHVVI